MTAAGNRLEETMMRLKTANDERAHLHAVLAMWAKVKAQGIDPEQVKAMTFDPARLSAAERNQLRRRRSVLGYSLYSAGNPYGWPVGRDEEGRAVISPLKYNVAVMRDGQRITLSPMIDRP